LHGTHLIIAKLLTIVRVEHFVGMTNGLCVFDRWVSMPRGGCCPPRDMNNCVSLLAHPAMLRYSRRRAGNGTCRQR
jgi:hypothetical protein